MFIGTRYIDWQWLKEQHRQKVLLTEWKSAVLKTTDSVPLNMSLTVERLCFTFQYLYWEISNSNTAEGCLSKDIWRIQCTLFSINSSLAPSYSLIYLFICLWLKAKFHFFPVSYILLILFFFPSWILFFWFDFRFFLWILSLANTVYLRTQSESPTKSDSQPFKHFLPDKMMSTKTKQVIASSVNFSCSVTVATRDTFLLLSLLSDRF